MSQDFPREYRIGGSGRRFLLGVGGLAFFGGLAGVVVASVMLVDPGARYVAIGLGGFFALLGLPALASVRRTRVWLYPDAIETRGIFIRKRMERADIAGRRFDAGNEGAAVIHLLPNTTRVSLLRLPAYIATDAAWDAWFASIPDMDAEERQKSLDAYLEDPDLLGTNDEKLVQLFRAKRVANGMLYISLAIGGWGWFYPHPYEWVVLSLALMPWITVAIAATGGAAYKFDLERNQVGAELSAPIIVPALVLLCRAMLDIEVLDQARMLWIGAAGTAVCVLVMWWFVANLRDSKSGAWFAALMMAGYAYGAVVFINCRFDESEAAIHPVKVLDTRTSTGNGRYYYLQLEPWGPRSQPEDVSVVREYFEQVKRGDTVCVYLRRGALRARWFEVGNCPRG